jgi:purine-binding chemotaxis protein CheW
MLAERPRVLPQNALMKDEKLMPSDQAIRHIALTCPHCGKHYKKVPYDAIKKHQFAFCKQCNNKFRVDPSVLEEALKQAVLALAGQSREVAATPSRQTPDRAGEHAPEPDQPARIDDVQTIPGMQKIVQQAAAAARDFLPEPPVADEPHDDGILKNLFDAQDRQEEEQPGLKAPFAQDMDKLAAAMDETFYQPQEAHPSEDGEGTAVENLFSDRAQFEQTLEPELDHPAPLFISDLKELRNLAAGEPIPGQPDEPAAEKNFEQELREASMLQQQAVDVPLKIATRPGITEEPVAEDMPVPAAAETASQAKSIDELIEEFDIEAPLEVAADQEFLEEPLIETEIAATQAETAPGEETFDESLIEEPDSEQFEQEAPDVIEEQGKTLDATNLDFTGSPDDTAANRDVASMLKDLVLPTADIREGMEQFVLFSLGEQLFAAPVANVGELSLPPDFIMLPNTPQWLLGIANMRGEIISIVDLRGFLGMDQENIKKTSRMIIAQTIDRQMMVGLIIDRINGIHYFATDDIMPLQEQAPGLAGAYVSGACAHEDAEVAILDLEKLLQSQKMRQFQ